MAIRALTRDEFEQFGATRVTLNGRARKAVEWFADDAGALLGSIACQSSDLNSSFMILKRAIYGRFNMIHLETGCRDADHARRLLFARMEAILGADGAVSAAPLSEPIQ